MTVVDAYLLSAIIFVPLLGALLALTFPKEQHSGIRGFAIATCVVDFCLALVMWHRFNPGIASMQMTERASWIPSFGITYSVGVDGLSLLLVVLTTFLSPLVILSTYSSVNKKIREYIICMLLLQTGMLGAFLATDLFLFYVFWELMLIPMYFLIGIWGGERRIYAAIKFFLYTMTGSLLMLVAILYTVWAVQGPHGLTFDWQTIAGRIDHAGLGSAATWLFLAFALAFAIKVPMFPFHTWLPDAHVEAPTGGSVILAGVLLKLGTFGFLRYAFWLFPKAAAEFLPALGLLAVIGILYGALVAMVQDDLKKLVAYSSVSHLGFVMLGLVALTVTGITGGVMQMVNHGISTAALFLLVGVIYERRHTRRIDEFGGLAKVMPWFTIVWVLITMSSIGVPGLNGFVGEFMILVGSFTSQGLLIPLQTGEIAWGGIVALNVVALLAVFLLASALGRATLCRGGRVTKVVTIAGATIVALVMVCPPVFGCGGGLLVKPLISAVGQGEAFGDIFAVYAVCAALGVIFSAVYMLWATQRVFFGPLNNPKNEALPDLSMRECVILVPLVLMAIVLGVFPKPALEAIEPTVISYTQRVRQRAGLPPEQRAAATGLQLRQVKTPPRAVPASHYEILPFRKRMQQQRRKILETK